MGITYFANRGDVDTIPNFVTARTPRGLRRQMLLNNIRLKAYCHYHSIQFVAGEGRWYAWFGDQLNPSEAISGD